MFKKFYDLYQKIVYISKLTSVGKKKLRILLSVLLSNLAVLFDIILIVSFATLLTDKVSYDNPLILNGLDVMTNSSLGLPLLVILRFLFSFLEKINLESLTLNITENLKHYLMKQVFIKGNLSTNDSYFYITQVSGHVSQFYRTFAVFLNSALQIIGYSLFLLFTDSEIFTFFLIGGLFILIPARFLLKKGKHYQHIAFIEAKNVHANIQRIIDNVFLIKILKTKIIEFQNFLLSLKKYTSSQLNNVVYGALNSILPTFSTLFILTIILTTTEFVKTITIEFIGVLLRLFQSLSSVINGLNLVINSSVHVEELYKLDKASPLIIENNYQVNSGISNAIELENVSFKYLNSEEEIFKNLTLEFPKNTHTIITGPNGSGKSTLLGLISGLYIAKEGKVKNFSDKLGYIGVTPLVFEGTLRENLLYGNNQKIDDQQIIDLIINFQFFPISQKINLEKKVSNKSLSSGQMQKISFMRSILNKSEILLLDEATSNLDTGTKHLIFNILKNLKITIINSTHNKDDFDYDAELKIEIKNNQRLIQKI
jgi:ABC-type multidrug transport system fused ATPase/permease subunit